MKQILKVTIILDLLLCVAIGIFALFSNTIGFALYVALLLFASYFLPILIFTALYHVLLGKRHLHLSKVFSVVIKGLLLFALSFIGLFVWALLEFVVTDNIKNFSWGYILKDYTTEYLGYLPIAMFLAFLIPAVYVAFTPKITAANSHG